MNRPVAVVTLMMLAVALLASPASAQIFGEPTNLDRPDWGLEASFSGQFTEFDFTQVNDHLELGPQHFVNNNSVYTGYSDQSSFDNDTVIDIRLGARYKGFRLGGGFASIPERDGGFTLTHQLLGPTPYELTVSAREFYAYAGYLYPVSHVIEVGLIGAIGFGTASGTLTDFRRDATDIDMEGTFSPLRLEAHGQINLTRYAAINLMAGIRSANNTDMEAEYGINGLDVEGSSGPVTDYQDQPMEFDFGGWYVGGGLTLKNPFDSRY